jgi:hypothetical protein
MNEAYPLEHAGEVYERILSSQARFRVILDLDSNR